MTIEQPSAAWQDYELIDSGDFSKLERWGPYVTIRPEPKALWPKTLTDKEWYALAHTEFKPGAGFGKAGKEDSGTWNMVHKMQEQWTITYPPVGFTLRLGLTSFKHVGVFPEQAPNAHTSRAPIPSARTVLPRFLFIAYSSKLLS